MGARRWRPGLRGRLLLALVAVTAAVSLTVGLLSVVLLQSVLVGRLDDQLVTAVARTSAGRADEQAAAPPGRPGPRGPGGVGFLLVPGQAEGTLGAEVRDGDVVRAAVLGPDGRARDVDPGAAAALLAAGAGAGPVTVDVAGLGPYRVLARAAPDGATLVTGLPLAGVRATSSGLLAISVTATAAGLVVVVLLGGAVLRRALRPLREVTRTAAAVRQVDLSSGEVVLPDRVPAEVAATADEVGEVAAALNRALDHVEAALLERHRGETRMRRLVADASHELRTPLASIQGYSELVRRRPGPVPADVAAAMGRVESEAHRMAGLVEDLLLLARLDSGRPLAREPVDLVPVVVTALADAHAASPRHVWRLDLDGAGDGPVVVTGDAQRLQQVLANLLGNARVHTAEGTDVTVRLAREAGDAVLRVVDDGPGVPESLRTAVFERFTRADASRSRAAGSTGLGLSIVAAVVAAHGGTVACPARARGAEFVVRLPLA